MMSSTRRTSALYAASQCTNSRYRDLHALSLKLHDQLQPLVEDAKSLAEIPELDTNLLKPSSRLQRECKAPCPFEPQPALTLNAAQLSDANVCFPAWFASPTGMIR